MVSIAIPNGGSSNNLFRDSSVNKLRPSVRSTTPETAKSRVLFVISEENFHSLKASGEFVSSFNTFCKSSGSANDFVDSNHSLPSEPSPALSNSQPASIRSLIRKASSTFWNAG